MKFTTALSFILIIQLFFFSSSIHNATTNKQNITSLHAAHNVLHLSRNNKNNNNVKRNETLYNEGYATSSKRKSTPRPLSNNAVLRGISDKMDSTLESWRPGYKSKSWLRAGIHGLVHQVAYHVNGNPRERERAKDQFNIILNKPTNNLKNYDDSHF